MSAVPGRRYRISAYAYGSQVSATGTSYFYVEGLIEGLAIARLNQANSLAAGGVLVGAAVYLSAPGVSGSQSYVLKGFSTAGALRVNANYCSIFVDDIGS